MNKMIKLSRPQIEQKIRLFQNEIKKLFNSTPSKTLSKFELIKKNGEVIEESGNIPKLMDRVNKKFDEYESLCRVKSKNVEFIADKDVYTIKLSYTPDNSMFNKILHCVSYRETVEVVNDVMDKRQAIMFNVGFETGCNILYDEVVVALQNDTRLVIKSKCMDSEIFSFEDVFLEYKKE